MIKKQTIEDIVTQYTKVGECWEFHNIDTEGYGRTFLNGKQKRAHRIFYEYFKEPIPKGLVIDHLCRNHACVNPNHLEVVTIKVNNNRGIGVNTINRLKTHCSGGHLFTEDTIYESYLKKGERRCKICTRDNDKKRKLKKKAIKC